MGTPEEAARRNGAVDAAKTIAIFGTLLIHASANGGVGWPAGSLNWTVNLAWSSVLRCAVPVFFLCSGALLLPPEKDASIRRVWRRYIPRIFWALLFWAAAYAGWQLLLGWRASGVLELTALRQAADLVLFRHKSHLYYLHIMLLLYAVLPATRLFAAKADRRLLGYVLLLWFVLGSLLPAVRTVWPLSLIGGIPAQYPLNLTWGAVGYTLLGYALSREARTVRPGTFLLLFLAGFALTFGGPAGCPLSRGLCTRSFCRAPPPASAYRPPESSAFASAAFGTGPPSPGWRRSPRRPSAFIWSTCSSWNCW